MKGATLARNFGTPPGGYNPIKVQGYCPMGCGPTLFVDSTGYIACTAADCEDPAAIAKIPGDRETEHIVAFDRHSFSTQHPLKERLNGLLFDCEIHDEIRDMGGPPPEGLGRYRVLLADDGLKFEKVA